jgi:uncharacterized repeat protein (TIGR03803 family)
MTKTRVLNRSALLVIAILFFGCLTAPAQDFRILHHFAGGANDGSMGELGTLVQSGSCLYGMTVLGGSNNLGTVFKINTDGTGFELLHSFAAANADGSNPMGSLLLSGTTLYGMTTPADTTNRGTIFAVNTDGSGFQVLHSFTNNEGKWPWGSLIQSGAMLYGLTTYGGNNNGSGWVGGGTMFRMSTNGTGFQVLHTFLGGINDGWMPHGSLVQSGTKMYGTTPFGGTGGGVVFRSNLDGSQFELLHRFSGGSADGRKPVASTLLISGSTLYGVTQEGGAGIGTVYRMNTDGTGFALLHSFAGGESDGSTPDGLLAQSGSVLYGITLSGGIDGNGAVFQISTNGTGFQPLHKFAGGANDGARPFSSPLLSGSTLYAMTEGGGSNNLGVIFALDLPRPTLAISLNTTNVTLSWSTNFPDFALESVGQLTGAWTSVPGVTGYSAALPVNLETNQFFRLRR